MEGNIAKKKNMPSLSILVSGGIVKMCTAENIASSGSNYSHLKTVFERKGEDGLVSVFQMENSKALRAAKSD